MRQTLGFVLALALITFAGAHLSIVVALLRRKEWKSAALSFVLPPLGLVAALDRGMRRTAIAWIGSFLLYAIILALV